MTDEKYEKELDAQVAFASEIRELSKSKNLPDIKLLSVYANLLTEIAFKHDMPMSTFTQLCEKAYESSSKLRREHASKVKK